VTAPNRQLFDDVAAVYRTTLAGAKLKPHTLVTNGAVLNAILGVEDYDPAKAYQVTADGVTEVEVLD